MKETEKEQGKERYLEKGRASRGSYEGKEGKGREKRKERGGKEMCMCLLNVCVELCVYCVILSPATRVEEGWTGLI